MCLKEVLRSRRSIRRFKQKQIEKARLYEILEAARFAPTGGNLQELRFLVVLSEETAKEIFIETAWGASVRPARNPEWGVSAPTAFIAVSGPAGKGQISHANAGAAVQNMLLQAADMGLGACWLGAFDRKNCARILGIDSDREILYLVALGYPDEDPATEDTGNPDDCSYYLDDSDRIHVPKLTVDVLSAFY